MARLSRKRIGKLKSRCQIEGCKKLQVQYGLCKNHICRCHMECCRVHIKKDKTKTTKEKEV